MRPHWQAFAVETIAAELQRLGRNARVLEFGCGDSTIWLSKLCDRVTSIEHDPDWFAKIQPQVPNVELLLEHRPYYNVCQRYPDETFDIVLVDGRNRKGCIRESALKVKPGGLLLLDDAEREYYKLGIGVILVWDLIPVPEAIPGDRLEQTRVWRRPAPDGNDVPLKLVDRINRARRQV